MTKTRAIKQFCLECSGDSPLTVTLCCSFDCPLWAWRLGVSMKTKAYSVRLDRAIKNHPEYLEDLSQIGVDIDRFSLKQSFSLRRTKELGTTGQTTGVQEEARKTGLY